ncbi:hypothetical protein SAMN04488498_1771 [Mesorhizobium albiziae]|uniref:Uncharacterized protein n=1 Tax=Neomesorhizobium albiziae TaxID=335020 RepID=A0A1I4G4S6_9HYPH|nr:hypothetical protein [Mesorhizobium albiziae]GLS34124.1 hypothetical protein GCM10007937_58380 [Mesorhizobium albiziae]SFL24081.1 hypothetical protein SAMN04488498_1771 [Mesorhizobium albiziae]
MTLFEEMRGATDDLLGEFAQGTVNLKRVTAAAPDPATPWIPGSPATVYPLDAGVKRLHQRFENGMLAAETRDMVTFAVTTATDMGLRQMSFNIK